MGAVLFLALFASLVLVLISFLYPFAILAALLQLIFTGSGFLLVKKYKAAGKSTFSIRFASFLHSLFLMIIVAITLFVAIPSAEDNDLSDIANGFKKMIYPRLGIKVDKPSESVNTNQNPDFVEDPF